MDVISTKYEKWLLPSIILITLAVFSPVIWNDFIAFDDDIFVYANANIASGVSLEVIRWAFTNGYEANWVPLSILSHAFDVQLFGLNPAGHHTVNLLLHVANSCLLFLFLKRATRLPWQSAAVAFLFALHPLHVESVAWVAERRDVLSTFFMMLTLYWYTRFTENKSIRFYCLSLVLFVLGLLSKPMLVSLPILLLLLDWWPLNRISCPDRSDVIRLIAEKIPFYLLSLCSSIITYRVQQAVGELPQGYTFASRLGKSCIAYITYVFKMFWPADLAILYPFSIYPPSNIKVALTAALLIGITAAVFLFNNRYPFLITGWLWYLVTLLPVIGLIQIGQHSVADRYTYIPLIGLFVVIVWGLSRLLETWRYRDECLGCIAVCVVAGMSWLTVVQLQYWKNSETLFKHTLEVTEGNWVIQNNLGLEYLNQGRVDEAIQHFNLSIQAKPSYSLAYLNLGAAYLTTKEYTKAVDAFKWSLQFDRNSPKARGGLVFAYLKQGKRDLALAEYKILEESGVPSAMSLSEIMEKAASH
ncbi:MAG: glycosyltransferase family 39 protein [Desulfuromonadaceae bacterium]|nr:glycosyltransferase family 39 protein [Desulfuromonadaceae bacterium]